MLDPEFHEHFAKLRAGPFWQGSETAGRVAVAPGLQAFEHGPFGARLMDDILTNETILNFAEMVMGPFVQLDSVEVTGYPGAGTSGNDGEFGTGWHRVRLADNNRPPPIVSQQHLLRLRRMASTCRRSGTTTTRTR